MKEKVHILLLHGALGCSAQLRPLQDLLKEKFQVHALNFCGHGGDGYDGPFSMELFVEDVVCFMDEQNISCCSIFGYSMGGYVAMMLAEQFPERVNRIMTLGTKFDWNPTSAAKEVSMLNPAVIEVKIPAFANLLKDRFQPADWKDAVRHTADMMLELGNHPGLDSEKLKNIRHEVIISAGSQDTMISLEYAREVAALLPNGRYLEWEGWPHPIEKADVTRLAGLINTFFNQEEGKG